jgi:DNA recombination protein RmuC
VKKLHTGRGNLVRRTDELRKLGAKAKKKLPAHLLEEGDEDGGLADAEPDAETAAPPGSEAMAESITEPMTQPAAEPDAAPDQPLRH